MAGAQGGEEPLAVWGDFGTTEMGQPLGLSADPAGSLYLADGIPGRILGYRPGAGKTLEFEVPAHNPGFYPADVKAHGFFIYAVDRVNRNLVRFDKDGAYRDILIDFSQPIAGARATPTALDVDPSGRIAVADEENHRIMVFDPYLSLEVSFGSYGAFLGQLDSPQGLAFTEKGDLVVADTGNRRLQVFGISGRPVLIFPQGQGALVAPRRVVVARGRFYVADPRAGKVFVFSRQGALEKALFPAGVQGFSPSDLAPVAGGKVWVLDSCSRSLYLFRG